MSLTAEILRSVVTYDEATGRIYWKDRPASDFKTPQGFRSWQSRCLGKQAGGDTGHGYRRTTINGRHYLTHRLVWLFVYGSWPSQHIDHINGNGLDNRVENLRDVSNTDNHRNVRMNKANTSGVTGVRFVSRYGTWRAAIWQDAKIIHLGSFQTKDEAVAARKAAERQHGYHPNHGRAA